MIWLMQYEKDDSFGSTINFLIQKQKETHHSSYNMKSIKIISILFFFIVSLSYKQTLFCYTVATLLWGCEDETHIPEMGTWEPSGTPKTLEFDCRGENTSHWGVIYIIGKLLKCRCRKWVHMGHLNICNTSYGKEKGRESNWQFDSQPLKVGNQPNLGVCRWNMIHHQKALKVSYKFVSDLILIEGLGKQL